MVQNMARKDHTTQRSTGLDNLGDEVAALRDLAGYTMDALAIKIGTSKSMLSKIENNKAPLTFAMLDRIAKVVHKTPEAVILYLLQKKYPRLKDTNVGKALKQISDRLNG